MRQTRTVRYRFADCLVDTQRFELLQGDEPVHVEPQVFDVLAHLLANRDRVVTKAELLDAVWGDQFVSESALTTRIKQVRQAVGDTGRDQRVVRTAHGRGYQFVAAVEAEALPAAGCVPGWCGGGRLRGAPS
jgi:DNA-binding winged helix-turn-helix (wHTH) protein